MLPIPPETSPPCIPTTPSSGALDATNRVRGRYFNRDITRILDLPSLVNNTRLMGAEYESSNVGIKAPGINLRKGVVLAETRGCHFGYPLMSLTVESLVDGLRRLAVLEIVLAPLPLETLAELRLGQLVEKLYEIVASIPPDTGMALEELLNQYNPLLDNLEWLDESISPLLKLAANNEPVSLRYDQSINFALLNTAEISTSTGKEPLILTKIPNRPARWNYYKQTSFFVEFRNIRRLANIPQQSELYSPLDALWWREAEDIATSLLKEFGIITEHENTIPVFMHWAYNCLKIIDYGFNAKSSGGREVVRFVPLCVRVGPFQEILELLSDETVDELVSSINRDRDNYLYEFIRLILLNFEGRKEIPSQRNAYDKLEQWLFHEVHELFKVLKIRHQHGKHHVHDPYSPAPYIVTKTNKKLMLPDPGKTADFLRDFVMVQRNDNYYFLYELKEINGADYCVVEFRLHQSNDKEFIEFDIPFNNPERPFDPSFPTANEQQMMALLFEK